MKRFILLILALSVFVLADGCISVADRAGEVRSREGLALPLGFAYVDAVAPGVIIDMRYASNNNFIGDVIDGYEAPKCILTREAASALRNVQDELARYSMSLKIFDAYRPQRAVDHFVRWSKDLSDVRMKKEYYPEIDKDLVFKGGFVWTKSNHSKGSTVDLTIIYMPSRKELDMGSHFDFFGSVSWTECSRISQVQKANRLLLKSVMEKHGFVNYEKEWWHYTLKNEPYPDTYFNFPVR